MKTLYESILDKDFDVNEDDIKARAVKDLIKKANYDQDYNVKVTIKHGNHLIIDYPNDYGWTHEFIFDDFLKGLREYGIGVIEFKQDCKLLYLPREIKDLTIIGKQIEIGDYGGSSRIWKDLVLKDVEIFTPDPVTFFSYNISMDSKCSITCSFLSLYKSTLKISKQTKTNIDEIRVITPPNRYLQRFKRVSLLDLYTERHPGSDKDFWNDVDFMRDYSKVDPTEIITGTKIDSSSLYKITVVPESTGGWQGLVFIKSGQVIPRGKTQHIVQLANNWSCYCCTNATYDIY